jgi:hypothetical protein
MYTLNVIVTGTRISPFNEYDIQEVLHGGQIIDPFASPLSFYYASSAIGGTLTSSTFLSAITGGPLFLFYDDIPNENFILDGYFIFCDSNVVFDFSSFDQSESNIVKLIFNPNNGSKNQTFNSTIVNGSLIYPNLSNISSSYYPSESFYTIFNPEFKIQYEDGIVVNLTIPLSCVQCGIFESYKNKGIVECLPFYKQRDNVLLFVNDRENDDLILTNISTNMPFELDDVQSVSLDQLGPLAIPLIEGFEATQVPIVPNIPEPPTNQNPVNPPTPLYIYSQGFGINIVPNNSIFAQSDVFTTNTSLFILSGGAPYFQGSGISITVA